ncbi:MAG: FAD-binding oxidoreductase [Myxococcales bacterium]|nr:FAD-binding oxidoreductase [Myxococcales bacterium]
MSSLADALGPVARDTADGGVLLAPGDERALANALHVLADQGARLNRDATLSRERLTEVGPVEPRSMTLEVGAGVVLQRLDDRLRTFGLTVGPLSPSAMQLTLGDFLEGPFAGLRAIPGGRLEPLCTRLVAVLADGRRLETSEAPRSAAGPDLSALVLGGHGRLGVVTRARVRCFPLPEADVRATYSLPSPAAFVTAFTRAVAEGAWPWRVHVDPRSGRVVAEVRLAGSAGAVERDRDLFGRCVDEAGGRPSGDAEREGPVAVSHESTWPAVQASLEAGRALQLFRLSLGTVVARGDVDGLRLDEPTAWSSLGGRLLALDPRGVLGGAP